LIVVANRHQHVTLWIIPGKRATRQLVGCKRESVEPAVLAVVHIGHQRDRLSVGQPCLGDILGAHQQDIARAVESAQTIRIAIDRGIELVV